MITETVIREEGARVAVLRKEAEWAIFELREMVLDLAPFAPGDIVRVPDKGDFKLTKVRVGLQWKETGEFRGWRFDYHGLPRTSAGWGGERELWGRSAHEWELVSE